MKNNIVNKARVVLLGALVLTSCTNLIKPPALELGTFTQQELNEARRIRHDSPYWYGITNPVSHAQ